MGKSVKLRVKLPGGTVIEIEGDESSVAKTAVEIDRNLHRGEYKPSRRKVVKPERVQTNSGMRPSDALQELVNEGFFAEKRTIEEVGNALSEKGVDTHGKKISGIALLLNQWIRERRFGLEKEALSDNEKLSGVRGSWRYFTTKNL